MDAATKAELIELGQARHDAMIAKNKATELLWKAVLRALTGGCSESEVARAAGVDRMTVRAWAGK